MVFFANPKRSTIDIAQASGRALRLDPSNPNKVGLIVLPVLTDSNKDFDHAVTEGTFREVVNVVRAMSDEDEDLKGYLSAEMFNFDRSHVSDVEEPTGKLVLVNFDPTLRSGLFTKIISNSVVSWDSQYSCLCEYMKLHPGSWPSSTLEFPEGNRLGKWCEVQRGRYRMHKLSADRISRLQRIDFKWDEPDTWIKQYRNLQEFMSLHPGRWPLAKCEFPSGNRLGGWCSKQRARHREYRLSQDRVDMLDKIGFWAVKKPDAWDIQFSHLVTFMKHTEDWPISTTVFPDGNKLGSWCKTQRSLHKHKMLPQERCEKLDSIGFPWNSNDRANAWMIMYRQLLKYKDLHPTEWPSISPRLTGTITLSGWCYWQRLCHRKSRLSRERVELLNMIGFSWAIDDPWMKHYHTLCEYRNLHSHCCPSGSKVQGKFKDLQWWCSAQRKSRKRHKLSQDKITLLDQIGFLWEMPDKWMDNYKYLKEYINSHSGQWPASDVQFPKGNKLGSWYQQQRCDARHHRIKADHLELLHDIGFTCTLLVKPWLVQYKKLLEYRKRNEIGWPPKSSQVPEVRKLWKWCNVQRAYRRLNKLSEDRITLLNQLGFRWSGRIYTKKAA